MLSLIVHALLISICAALTSSSASNSLTKRESGQFACYDLNKAIFEGFSALCPPSEWPIDNNRGLNAMEVFYFALASSNVPDNTTYETGENIICTVVGPSEIINVTASASASKLGVTVGAVVSFSLSLPAVSNSICMFTESLNKTGPADNITLVEARDQLYTMLTAPNVACKTCGRIPIHYPNVTDGNGHGGILKLDVRTANNCIGKCVGPNSFVKSSDQSPDQASTQSTTMSTTQSTTQSSTQSGTQSATPSPTESKSHSDASSWRLRLPNKDIWSGLGLSAFLAAAVWMRI